MVLTGLNGLMGKERNRALGRRRFIASEQSMINLHKIARKTRASSNVVSLSKLILICLFSKCFNSVWNITACG